MADPIIDTEELEDLAKKVAERATRLAERGLEELDKGVSGVAKAAQEEIECALGLVEKSTGALKGFLDGRGREETERLFAAATETARKSASRWLNVAADAVARARDLTDAALGGKNGNSARV